MTVQKLNTKNAPAAIGPYSQGLDIGALVFVSGQIPINPETGSMADSIEEQTKQSLNNLQNILAESKLTMKHVVKTTVFLQDLDDFAKMNAVYETFFTAPFPTRSCVQVAAIPKGSKVEIECIASR
ncbi:MAG: RidA family protein [Evtepia sp.]